MHKNDFYEYRQTRIDNLKSQVEKHVKGDRTENIVAFLSVSIISACYVPV